MKTIAILGLSLLLTACDQQNARPFNPSDLDSIDQRVIEQLDYIDDVVAEQLDLIDENTCTRWCVEFRTLTIDWENSICNLDICKGE
jgi:hypothetical protein